MILLNLRKGTKFEHDLIYNKSLDISLRKDIKNFEIDTSEKEILKQIDELIVNESDQYLHNLKTKYFGKKTSLNLHEAKKFLERKLNT